MGSTVITEAVRAFTGTSEAFRVQDIEVSQNWGYLFRGPHNKDYSILGSILGSPYFGKLPYWPTCEVCLAPKIALGFFVGFGDTRVEFRGLGFAHVLWIRVAGWLRSLQLLRSRFLRQSSGCCVLM